MVSAILSRIVILVFGTLYPAYASYKAVRTKNVKEYVKWMMYWIVFAFFTTAETFADILLSWVPFYYEVKILFVLWLLSPATKGSNFLYRKFVHPQLARREGDIDEYLARVSQQGYSALLSFGSRGVNYATKVVLDTAMKGQASLAEQLKKSYSMNDVSVDEAESREVLDNRLNEDGIDSEDYGELAEEPVVLRKRASDGAGDDGRHYSLRERRNRKTQSAAYS